MVSLYRCCGLDLTESTGKQFTLPYLQGGQVVTPAQHWGRISSAQCTTPM